MRLYGALAVVAVAVSLAWAFWPPTLRVTAPTLETGRDKITVSATVTNNTSLSRAVTVRFALGYTTFPSDYAPTKFVVFDTRDITAQVQAHSRETVRCDLFPPTEAATIEGGFSDR